MVFYMYLISRFKYHFSRPYMLPCWERPGVQLEGAYLIHLAGGLLSLLGSGRCRSTILTMQELR
jgi:hypothetical protein